MTDEQIKQIAEEYREDIINRMGIPKDFISADVRKGLASDCTAILNWLNTRYCVVERSKVEHEMINANRNIDLYKLYPKVVSVNRGVKGVLTKLFGSKTFNKKEE